MTNKNFGIYLLAIIIGGYLFLNFGYTLVKSLMTTKFELISYDEEYEMIVSLIIMLFGLGLVFGSFILYKKQANKENNNSKQNQAPQKINPNVAIGIGINVISWTFAITVNNHSLIWLGVIGCLIGALFCYAAKNWILVFICIIDSYLLWDLNKDLKSWDKDMQQYEQQMKNLNR